MTDDAPDWANDSAISGAPDWAKETTPDVGKLNAAGRGVLQGATFGFSDELRAIDEAGGAGPTDPGTPVTSLKGAYKYWTGDPEAVQRYDQAITRERAADETAKAQHPYVYGASEVAGAIPSMAVLPEAGMARAPALLRPVLKGAQVGAEYGALSGAGAGTDASERVIGAGTGAVAGGVGGGAGAGILQGIGAVLGPIVGKAIGAFNGWKDPEAEASRRLGAALMHDQEAIANGDAKGMSAQDWLAAKRAGEPVTLADLGAGNTQALLRSAGNTAPDAWAKLESTFNERFLGQSERVAKDVKDLVAGGANANKTSDQIVAEYDAGRVPAYAKAFKEGDKEIVSPVIERLMGSPTFEDAMKRAVTSGKDRAVSEGYGAFNPGVTVENGMIKFTKTNPKGVPQYPNLQYWDAVKRELDSMASVARRQGDTSSVAGNLASTLRGELDTAVPSYGSARGVASQYFNESNALEAGRTLAGKKVDPQQIITAMRQMKPDEQELFREGYASDWADRVIKNISDTRDITKAMFNSPNERARALAVFGQSGLDKMQARMALETVMQGAKNAMGNSTTAKQLIEAGMAGGLVGGYESGWDWKHVAGGSLAGSFAAKKYAGDLAAMGARKIMGRVDSKTASHVADLLTSNDLTQMRKGLDMAMKNKAIMDGLRRAANTAALGTQSPASSAIASYVPQKLLMHSADQSDQRKPPTNAGFARGGNVSDPSQVHSTAGYARGGAVHNHNPSEAQKKAGNYSKTHRFFHGLDITLENLKGHPRSGIGRNGKRWSVTMPASYGYIKRTEGADGDHVDCYLGPNEKSDQVFVVDQKDAETGKFDEHKTLLGFSSEKEALKTYRAGFSDGKDRVKHVKRMTISEFRDWLERGNTSKPIKVALRLAYEEKKQRHEA